METKAKFMAGALLIAGLSASHTYAQNQAAPAIQTPGIAVNAPVPDGQPGAPGPNGPGKPHGRGPQGYPGKERSDVSGPGRTDARREGPGEGKSGLTSLTTVSGTVGQLTANDDFIFDGFTLNAGSAPSMAVKFPAHLGQQVQKAVKSGSTVSVTGYSETSPRGETQFKLTSLTAGKTTVLATPPAAPAPPAETPALVTATGKVADYRLDREGRVNGLVMDNRTIVRIPPHAAYQLTNLATKGSTITVQGYPKTLRDGQVQLEKTNILRASVLTINGQQYLVR